MESVVTIQPTQSELTIIEGFPKSHQMVTVGSSRQYQ
jgi:hypothetical protein